MSNQPNMSKTVIFRSGLLRDSIANLSEYLSNEGLGVRDKDYNVIPLGDRKYVIGFKKPPDKYPKLLEQIGKIL